MVVYLDICSLKKPLDDQRDSRIAAESEAVLKILSLLNFDEIVAVRSPIHDLENIRNPNTVRANAVQLWLDARPLPGNTPIKVTETARNFVQNGLQEFDALPLAWAKNLGAGFFITTDDALISFGQRNRDIIQLEIVNPTTFVVEMEE